MQVHELARGGVAPARRAKGCPCDAQDGAGGPAQGERAPPCHAASDREIREIRRCRGVCASPAKQRATWCTPGRHPQGRSWAPRCGHFWPGHQGLTAPHTFLSSATFAASVAAFVTTSFAASAAALATAVFAAFVATFVAPFVTALVLCTMSLFAASAFATVAIAWPGGCCRRRRRRLGGRTDCAETSGETCITVGH